MRMPYRLFRKKSGKPFTRFIQWSHCAKTQGREHEPSIRQMARDAVVDENVSYEDAVLLPDHHEELRAMGFDRYLPPPDECP